MGFENIDRQFQRRELILGLPVLATTLPALAEVRQPELLEKRQFDIITAIAVGSRCTCSPPPVGTDQDWLCLLPCHWDDKKEEWCDLLHAQGWEGQETAMLSEDYPSEFTSMRRGEDNLIIAWTPHFFERFKTASLVARQLNLRTKPERVMLFQAILYNHWEPPCPPSP